MDFIFEDDMDEVGSDIEAYCPKCKADTSHTVITKYEDEIRRVQCSPCGDVHGYRKPRGEVEEEQPEPVAAKKRAAAKKPTWEEAKAKAGEKKIAQARPYSIRDLYSEGDIVTHPKFAVGFVTEISENKVEITFVDERRVLIHNRPDLAAQMPAIAPLPAPREDKKKGKGKAAAALAKKAAELAVAKAKLAAAAAAKAAAAKPVAAKGPEKKQARARAAATKKSAAKGKKPSAKPAKRPAPRPARKARPVRSAARRPVSKPKAKIKAKKR